MQLGTSLNGNGGGTQDAAEIRKIKTKKIVDNLSNAEMSGALGGQSAFDHPKLLQNLAAGRRDVAQEKAEDFDDLYDVSDKENEQPSTGHPRPIPKGAAHHTPLALSSQWRAGDSQFSRQTSRMRRQPQATPLRDSSALSLANFKRRPRQPSILGIGPLDETPTLSSLGGLSGESGDELDDFQPEDESTPLQIKSPVLQTSLLADSSHRLPTNAALSPRQSWKSLDSDEAQSEPPSLDDFSTVGEGLQDEPALPSLKLSSSYHPIEVWDEVMALPESDSSNTSQPMKRPGHSRTAQQHSSAAIAPSETQAGGSGRHLGASRYQQASKSVSTAALQDFLPRRTHGVRDGTPDDESDINSPAGENQDDDELSFLPPGRRTARTKASSSKTSLARAKKSYSAGAGKRRNKPNPLVPQVDASNRPNSEVDRVGHVSTATGRTYSRHRHSREEVNDSLVAVEDHESSACAPDHSSGCSRYSSGLPQDAKTEMRKVAKRFKEVDEWQMEFEDVTGRSSSPRDRR